MSTTTILETPKLKLYKLKSETSFRGGSGITGINNGFFYEAAKSTRYNVDGSVKKWARDRNMGVQDVIHHVVCSIREPIADVQEKRGISKSQHFSFIDLMVNIFNLSYNACVAILTMLMGLIPLVEGLLCLIRFILDKILEINDTDGTLEKAIKCFIFVVELGAIFLFVTLILAVILMPVLHLVWYIFSRAVTIIHS